MTKIVAPDKGVRETAIEHRLYKPDRGGLYNVENKGDIKAMKSQGYFEASLNSYSQGDAQKGYSCVECGFNGWFRKCGRCGHEPVNAIATDGD